MLALIGGALALGGHPGAAAATEPKGGMAGMQEMVFVDSRFPYAETVKRLKAAIQAQGMRVVFVDDQQATLARRG